MVTCRASLPAVPTRPDGPLIGNRRSHDFAEQPVLLAERTCREEERVRRSCRRAVTERECPQAVDRQRLAIGGMELTALQQLAGALEAPEVEGVDVAIAKVPDEQVTAELPEIARGDSQPPGGVQPPARCHATEQIALSIERIHEPMPYARDIVVLVGVLKRVGDVNRPTEIADPERRIARR